MTRRFLRFFKRHRSTIVLSILGACFLFAGLTILWAATLTIPDLSTLETRKIEQSLKIYERLRMVIDIGYGVERRQN